MIFTKNLYFDAIFDPIFNVINSGIVHIFDPIFNVINNGIVYI